MSNQEILEKAIQKAIDGGWSMYGKKEFEVRLGYFYSPDGVEYRAPYCLFHDEGESTQRLYDIIFNHDFAKTLWGGKDPEFWHLRGKVSGIKAHGSRQVLEEVEKEPFIPEWQYHLQQMVIADDPIKYLGENI